MGGIATAIRNDEKQFCLKVEEGEDNDEFIITRHGQFLKPINICNVYGEQEGRNQNHAIEERWAKICNHLKVIEERNEEAILIGDMNKLVGHGPLGVENNTSKVTFGGKLVHRLLEDGKYLLLNNSKKCTGGPFTRIDPSDSKTKSCLSLVIISPGLEEFFDELRIDEKREFTPHRAIKKGGKLVFTDHFSLLLKFKNIPLKDKNFKPQRNNVVWNTNKEDGWKRFMDLTSNCEKLVQIPDKANHLDSEEVQLTRRMEKIKFQFFWKSKDESPDFR